MGVGRLAKPTSALIRELAETMSIADAAEVEALGSNPLDALQYSVEGSRDATAWIVDGEVACMFGAAEGRVVDAASPWMLSSPVLRRHARFFARGSKIVVARWRWEHPILFNHVDVRHGIAVNWIKWLGFKIHDPVPQGPFGLPFYPFEATQC